MPESHTFAKISKPKISNVYNRSRLFKLLDSFRDVPLIWVKGPPGAGKTTLVSSYLEKKNLSNVWYQVDKRDADVATFFHYMGAAVNNKTGPSNRNPLPIFAPVYFPALETFTLNYFEKLYARISAPTCIVLDNYQETDIDAPFHQITVAGVLATPPESQVIVISRSAPPPLFARLIAHKKLATIGWGELKLTADEATKVARRHAKKSVNPPEIKRLYELSDGWAAGLVLLAERTSLAGDQKGVKSDDNLEVLFDYFALEILNDMEGQEKEILLKLAFLPKITGDTSHAVLGREGGIALLEKMSSKNSFVEKRGNDNIEYQFHQMFRDFLLAKAGDYFTADELISIMNVSANALEQADQVEDAVELYIQNENYDKAKLAIINSAEILASQGRGALVSGWLKEFPEEHLIDDPLLLYWLGKGSQAFDIPGARAAFQKSYNLYKEGDDIVGLILSFCSLCDTIYVESWSCEALHEIMEEMEILLGKYDSIPSKDLETYLTVTYFSFYALSNPGHERLQYWENKLIDLMKDKYDFSQMVAPLFVFIAHQLWMGDFEEAGRRHGYLSKFIDGDSVDPLSEITLLAGKSAILFLTGEIDKSLEQMEKTVKLGEKSGVVVWNHQVLGMATNAALNRGDTKRASAYFTQYDKTTYPERDADQSFYHGNKALYFLIEGKLDEALTSINKSLELTNIIGIPSISALNNSLYASILVELGDFEEARMVVNKIRSMNKDIESALTEFQISVAESHIFMSEEDEHRLKMALTNLMAVGRENNIINSWNWHDPLMTKLCIKALEYGIETEYVTMLIKARSLTPDTPPYHLDNWPWKVKIYSENGLKVFVDGATDPSWNKSYKKPLELLKMIIDRGGEGVLSDYIVDKLWADMDGDKAQKAFYTTLYRLRKFLDDENAIAYENGLISINRSICWVE